jgi:hypothetical protein
LDRTRRIDAASIRVRIEKRADLAAYNNHRIQCIRIEVGRARTRTRLSAG